MKFNLHQSIQLSDEEKNFCMWIESSLLPFDELAPTILQEDTSEVYKFEANSFPTKEFAFELVSPILEVQEFILTHNEDEEGIWAMMDEGPTPSSQTSPKCSNPRARSDPNGESEPKLEDAR